MEAAMEYLLIDLDDTSEYRSVQNFNDNAINPCVESTYAFVEHVIEEVIQMHEDIQPLKVFNFGGDEVPRQAWMESPVCQELFGEELDHAELAEYFAQRVGNLAHVHGLDLAGWEDGLMSDVETPFNRSAFASDNVYGYFWNNIWEAGVARRAYIMANADYKVIVCGVGWAWEWGTGGTQTVKTCPVKHLQYSIRN